MTIANLPLQHLAATATLPHGHTRFSGTPCKIPLAPFFTFVSLAAPLVCPPCSPSPDPLDIFVCLLPPTHCVIFRHALCVEMARDKFDADSATVLEAMLAAGRAFETQVGLRLSQGIKQRHISICMCTTLLLLSVESNPTHILPTTTLPPTPHTRTHYRSRRTGAAS